MGAKGSCETGACPLTSNPYIGAVYGAIMGYLLVAVFLGPTMTKQSSTEDSAMATATSSAVTPITTKQQFQEQVLDADVPVLVDLWAAWCGPCRAQMPIVEALAERVGDKARVVKVDIDQAGEVAEELNVSSIPTLIVFQKGKEAKRFVGTQSADTLGRALGV